MKRINFEILGKKWTLRLLKRKRYFEKHGADSIALTKVHKRRIDLAPSGTDLETIIHELVHAYLTEICTHTANLDDEQLEEIFAELMAKRGREMLDLADRLHAQVTELTSPKITKVTG